MFDAGWLVPGNPPEYGGRNATLLEQFVHQEELGRRRIYASFNPQGLGIIVPSILAFGTEEQKQRWAVPILRAEITAALGMSEPDAGSDLAGLRTRATLDGDHFVVNGQKVWTSGAHDADVILAFVRTDPDAPKHKGISVLLVPTDSPGLTRRPFGSIVGPDDLDFNEVFFDDVAGADGEPHRRAATRAGGSPPGRWATSGRCCGWASPSGSTTSSSFGGGALRGRRPRPTTRVVLDRFGNLVVDAYALRLLGYRTLAKARRGVEATEQSILKLFGSEAVQAATLDILEALGPEALDHTRPSAPGCPLQIEAYTASWFELLPAQLRRHHRRRHVADPAQHRRRTRPRPPPLDPASPALTTAARRERRIVHHVVGPLDDVLERERGSSRSRRAPGAPTARCRPGAGAGWRAVAWPSNSAAARTSGQAMSRRVDAAGPPGRRVS